MLINELILVILFLAGIFIFCYSKYIKKTQPHKYNTFFRIFLPFILFILVTRLFIFQPFKVVSGSLEPTILIGDVLWVNLSAYSIRFPISHKIIFSTGHPKRGDIVLFHYPLNTDLIYIKRIIGLPGDHLSYSNKTLYINGVAMNQKPDGYGFDVEPKQNPHLMLKQIENLAGLKHHIFIDTHKADVPIDIIIPKGKYFVMGDNRDASEDSRVWGFLDEEQIIGKAFSVLVSWDNLHNRVRFDRFGNKLI